MDNYIKKLVRELPNDAELGAKVREYINNQRTCCDNANNHHKRYDGKDYCLNCGKLIS